MPIFKWVSCADLTRLVTRLAAPWWCHKMETFSALLALCAGNSPVTSVFPSPSPVTQSFDVSFDLHLNKPLSKQSWGWWFETPSRPLWHHCNAIYDSLGNMPYTQYTKVSLITQKVSWSFTDAQLVFSSYICMPLKSSLWIFICSTEFFFLRQNTRYCWD